MSFPTESNMTGPPCDYEELVQEAECIILCRTCDGRITFLNRFGLHFFGFELEEVLGKHVIGTIVPPTDSAGRDLEEMIREISRAPEQYVCNENENICRDGRRVWVGWRNKAVRDATGNVRELICVGTDLTSQRQANERLREYEARFRTVFEKATDGILLIERDANRITAANAMICRMLGYEEGELVGRPLSDVLPSGECTRMGDMFKGCSGDVSEVIKGIPLCRKDGSALYADISVWMLSVAGQDYVAGLFRDATDRMDAHEERRLITQRLDSLSAVIEASPAIVLLCELDQQWSMELVSGNVAQFGYDSRELIMGKVGWKTVVHPHDLPALQDSIANEIQQNNGQFTNRYRIFAADNQVRHVEAYSRIVRDTTGKAVELQTVLLDVTLRQTVEQALSREHAFRRAVETSLRPGIIAFDLEGRQTYVSKAFCDMTDWTSSELVGNVRPYRYLRPESEEQLVPPREQILSGEVGTSTREIEVLRRDGTAFKGLAIGAPLKSEEGEMLGWVASVADLTDRQQTAERISRLNDCFLGFGIDPSGNIQRLVEVAGKIMNADCAAYNRLVGQEVAQAATWQALSVAPCPECGTSDLCLGVIQRGGEDVWVEHGLDGSKRVHCPDGDSLSEMQTYVGKALRAGEEHVGVLCALFRKQVEPSQEEKRLFGVIAGAIGVEEARRANTEQLVENRLKLRALTSQLATTEQRERRRIAHVLHDDVGQLLATACLKLDAIPDLDGTEAIRGGTTEIGKLIRSATSLTRSLTSQISVEFLQGVGLLDAIRSECKRLERHHGIDCTIEDDGSSADLDGELATLLFQAIRELLFNVTKHAAASHVKVVTERVGDDMRVSVCDNGVGFDPSKRPAAVTHEGGFGLFSTSEKLQYIGGRLEIESKPGGGATVALVAPFDFSELEP